MRGAEAPLYALATAENQFQEVRRGDQTRGLKPPLYEIVTL
jgi:hypothetical protein